MSKIEYSPKALEDLQHISNYISADWGEGVAKGILKKIISSARMLEEYLVSGIDLGKIIDVPTEYRYIFTEKNYIFYRLESDKIRIVRVLNDQQDFMQQLLGIGTESNED
jgi:plasmid stabilization system protein ParE